MSIRKGTSVIAGGIYIDNTPISGSANAVSSGGVYTALAGKVSTGHEVIEFQEPTAQNNYIWYRKYADGWVEQGGIGTGNNSFTLPIEMADTNYTLIGEITQNDNASLSLVFQSKSTTGFWARTTYSGSTFNYGISWQVSGMAA